MEKILELILSENNINTVIAFVILLFSFSISKILAKFILKIIFKIFTRINEEYRDNLIASIQTPVRILILVTGIYIAWFVFPYTPEIVSSKILLRIYSTVIILVLMWLTYRLCDVNSIIVEKIEYRYNLQFDRGVMALLSRIIKVVVLLVGIALIFQTWGKNISILLGSLGVLSAVIGLAAKDYLTNIFGGLVIVTDKPFSIGDYIETSQGIGIVEDISFRTTKIRSFEKAVITVPNAKLASEPITNYSRRDSRKATFTVGISYETPIDKIKLVVDNIREMLVANKDVEDDSIICHFDTFGDSSLNIFLNFYINKSDWQEYLQVKEEINISIMKILEKENVEIAFPSQSIYLRNS